MTVAAAYARFSSDAQREESIEIQLREITRLVESRGWDLGEVYTDLAISGTREDRPGFNRCVADGEARRYDVLVVYKMDRFARNVSFAQECKRRLFAAGTRLVSVREGEQRDTPDGFLMGGMSDLFAEYYSRNLSVMVTNGIAQSARSCRAAGRRLYGYRTGPDGRFEVEPAQADVVREMYSRYLSGESMGELVGWLNSSGERNSLGRPWALNTVANVLGNPAYYGLYRYAGIEVEGGMPAIVTRDDWEAVARLRDERKRRKRRARVNDYVLTDRAYCLRCGKAVCGTAGTGRNGTKYTYYGCVAKSGGCGLRVPSERVERTVVGALVSALSDPATADAVSADLVSYGATLPSHVEEHRREAAEARRRRDNLVGALMEGVSAESVREALQDCENRISELTRVIEREEAERDALLDPARARAFFDRFMDGAADDPERRRTLVETFVDRVYIDDEDAVVWLSLGEPIDDDGFMLERSRAIKKREPVGNLPVRAYTLWSGTLLLVRTTYPKAVSNYIAYALVCRLMPEE